MNGKVTSRLGSFLPTVSKKKRMTILQNSITNLGWKNVHDELKQTEKGRKVLLEFKLNKISKITNNKSKSLFIKKAIIEFGWKDVHAELKKRKYKTRYTHGNKNIVNDANKIRKEIEKITNGQSTLPYYVNAIGKGVSGLVVECISNDKCEKDLVLKVSKADKEWENEVKILKKITKYMKNNPKKDPIAPKFYNSFKIGNRGYILMQHAAKVFPGANNTIEWSRVGPSVNKTNVLNAVKNAKNRLHKNVNIHHGNMHCGNVWIAIFPDKTIKAYFIDFGRSCNYTTYIKRKHMSRMSHPVKFPQMTEKILPTLHSIVNEPVMNDNKVLEKYKL